MEWLLLLVSGAINALCFVIGARVGQTVSKGETVKMPELNPINAMREHKEKKQAEQELKEWQSQNEIIMHNINVYDGTSNGQRTVG